MLGVDFVINALFDTSGFRPAGDCAMVSLAASASKRNATDKKANDFTAPDSIAL
jgi:hypothetical protein